MGSLFASIKPVESTVPVDVTLQLDTITLDTMTELLLGAPLNNPLLFAKWFPTTVKVIKELDPNYGKSDAEDKVLYEEIMKFIRNTPVAKEVKDSPNKNYLENEMMFFALWQAAGGVVLGQRSLLRFYKDLSTKDRSYIQQEADWFYMCLQKSKPFNECFSRLLYVEKSVMEVLRLESPVANIRGRAIRDFLITSLYGRFQIKKGDWLQGNVVTAQRSPRIFEDSTKFSMHRNLYKTKKNFFDFGGPFYQKPTFPNHKCTGQHIAINFMKMFLLHFTRCDENLGPILQSPTKTGGILVKATKLKCPK